MKIFIDVSFFSLSHSNRTFSPTKPCDVVHTLKKRMVFYNPEPNFWIVMVGLQSFLLFFVKISNLFWNLSFQHLMVPTQQKEVKDGSNPTEYLDAELHDVVVEAVIRQIYRTFMVRPFFTGLPSHPFPSSVL